jgi:hypothetical protein
MLPRLRERLRPPSLATGIALLALSIAVTGTAVAAAPHLFAIAGKSEGHRHRPRRPGRHHDLQRLDWQVDPRCG